jgi:hypothetical protein
MANPESQERRGRSSAAATIVVEVPAHLKALAAPIVNLISAVGKRFGELGRDGRPVDYATVEREFAEHAAAIETAAHDCTLDAMAIESKRIEVHGGSYTSVGGGVGTYRTMAGPVEKWRPIFRRDGERNGKTVDVISLRTGAVGDGWLPGTAKAMAHCLQLGTSREAVKSARQLGRLPYSRASFERLPHLVGELWLKHHADIEDELIREFVIPDGAASISISLDRASVPMEEVVPGPPGRPRKNARKHRVI